MLLCIVELLKIFALVVTQIGLSLPDLGRTIAPSMGDARDVVGLIIVGLGLRQGDLKEVLRNKLKT